MAFVPTGNVAVTEMCAANSNGTAFNYGPGAGNVTVQSPDIFVRATNLVTLRIRTISGSTTGPPIRAIFAPLAVSLALDPSQPDIDGYERPSSTTVFRPE